MFDRYDLDVEVLDPPAGPGTESPKAVAAGEADLCLTGTTYYLLAAAEAGGDLPARFAGVLHQVSPLAAIVRDDAGLRAPADLAGRRLGGDPGAWLTKEYVAALAARGVAGPTIVPMPQREASGALGRGEIDAMCTFADALPSAEKRAGVPLCAVVLGGPTYASGLVAGDHLPGEVVARARLALADALRLQAADPEPGADAFCRRYPGTTRAHALASWVAFAPYALGHGPAASMQPGRWRDTIAHTSTVHRLNPPAPHAVYRPELAGDTTLIPEVAR